MPYRTKYGVYFKKDLIRTKLLGISKAKVYFIKVLILLAMMALYKFFLASRPGPGTDI